MTNVLFVCKANMGRSQIAEGLFNKVAAGSDHYATSAGLIDPKKRVEVPTRVCEVLWEYKCDTMHQRRKLLTPEHVAEADKIIWLATKPRFWLPSRELPVALEVHVLTHPWLWNDWATVPDFVPKEKLEYWRVPDGKDRTREFHQVMGNLLYTRVDELYRKLNVDSRNPVH